MSLTPDNIDAINDFIARYEAAGDRDAAIIPGKHPASERQFVAVLRALGVSIKGRRRKNPKTLALDALRLVSAKLGPNEIIDSAIREIEERAGRLP